MTSCVRILSPQAKIPVGRLNSPGPCPVRPNLNWNSPFASKTRISSPCRSGMKTRPGRLRRNPGGADEDALRIVAARRINTDRLERNGARRGSELLAFDHDRAYAIPPCDLEDAQRPDPSYEGPRRKEKEPEYARKGSLIFDHRSRPHTQRLGRLLHYRCANRDAANSLRPFPVTCSEIKCIAYTVPRIMMKFLSRFQSSANETFSPRQRKIGRSFSYGIASGCLNVATCSTDSKKRADVVEDSAGDRDRSPSTIMTSPVFPSGGPQIQ